MKRKIFITTIIIISGACFFYLTPLLPIITGYAAKNLASGVFVAGRTQESIEKEDLNFSFIKYNKNRVDYQKKEVTSQFLWGKSKAIYIEGFGCTLVRDYTENEIRNRRYSIVKPQPTNQDTIPWPMGDLIAASIPSGIDTTLLNKAVALAFLDTVPYKGTFAVIVVYKGQPVAEKYREGFTSDNKFLSWSMAKSFTNALVGIMVRDSLLDIDAPLAIDDWQKDQRKNITINNLMHMNSGLLWNEDYGNLSDVTIMLHKTGDMGAYAAAKRYETPADSVWVYSSGSTNLVCRTIRKVINNDKEYFEFPRKALFNKIGMRSAVWEVDALGTFVGSSYIYATMRDYARFGLLYLNNGKWLGEQILPVNWVKYSTTEANGSNGQYGAFFWLNKSGTNYPDVPRDMFCCRGHDGQYIYIVPSKQLVVVRTGCSKKGEFDYNKFLSEIVKSIK